MFPASVEGVIGAMVARREITSKRMLLNSRSLTKVLDTLEELHIPYSVINSVIVPIFKDKTESERCKETLRVRGVTLR